MKTLTISIGRNVGAEPMPVNTWRNFMASIERVLDSVDAQVFVNRAKSTGYWDGIAEESRTWVAGVNDSRAFWLDESIDQVRRDFNQEAIALTIGTTTLVGEV